MKKFVFFFFMQISFNAYASITWIWPDHAPNDTIITLRIYGGGFQSGINDIRLFSPGKPEILGYNQNIVSDNFLECDFDMTNQQTGTYSLVIDRFSVSDTLSTCFLCNHRWTFDEWKTNQFFWYNSCCFYDITNGDLNSDYNHDFLLKGWQDPAPYDIYTFGYLNGSWAFDFIAGWEPPLTYDYNLFSLDGNNDNKKELYYWFYQFGFNGSSYNWNTIFNNGGLLNGGDADNNGLNELYATLYPPDNNILFSIFYNNNSWDTAIIDTLSNAISGLVVGDAKNSGNLDMFICHGNILTTLHWNDSFFSVETVGQTTSAIKKILFGDINHDGTVEVICPMYGNQNQIYYFEWELNQWSTNVIDVYSPLNVAVGDGDNDGYDELYYISDYVYEFDYERGTTQIFQGVWGQPKNIIVYDEDEDGLIEVYAMYTYNDPYAWLSYTRIYSLKNRSDSLLFFSTNHIEFNITEPYDTSYGWFEISNIWNQNISIDSVNFSSGQYFSIIQPEKFPCNISPQDTLDVGLIFCPQMDGLYWDTLTFYTTDVMKPIYTVTLVGQCLGDTLPCIIEVFPRSFSNDANRILKVYGMNFDLNITGIKLIKENAPDIEAFSYNVNNENYLECEFQIDSTVKGNYDLVLESIFPDTLRKAVLIYHRYPEATSFTVTQIFDFSYNIDRDHCDFTYGDLDGDGKNELYFVENISGIHRFTRNTTGWNHELLGFGVNVVEIGDIDRDGIEELYTNKWQSGVKNEVWQFTWNGYVWDSCLVGYTNNAFRVSDIKISNLDYKKRLDLYVMDEGTDIYQFSYSMTWTRTLIFNNVSDFCHNLNIADLNKDSRLELWALTDMIYWNGYHWLSANIGPAIDYHAVVGDADNDGEIEMYRGANPAYPWLPVIQKTYYEPVGNWINDTINSNITGFRLSVGDADCDGLSELYITDQSDGLQRIIFDDTSWIVQHLTPEIADNLFISDADNDFQPELYFISGDKLYQLKSELVSVEENEELLNNGFCRLTCSSFSGNSTEFSLTIPVQSYVLLEIIDLSGRLVETPISGILQKGVHEIQFYPERAGVYFYHLETEDYSETGKFTVLR